VLGCGFDAGEVRLSQEQNRGADRVEAAFRVRYKTLDDLVIGYSKNLSKGGLFLRTPKLLAVDAVVELHIELPDGGGELVTLCRVAFARNAAEAAKSRQPQGMGIQFLDPKDETRSRIERFIAECSAELPASERPSRALDVLVVDDEEAYCEVAAEPFRARGDTVRIAHDGIDALALCLKARPDIILCDVQMPRMDGWQLLRLVRARPVLASVPIVFLTTLTSEDDRLLGYRLGVDDFIAKPYRPQEVVARADRAVARADKASDAAGERGKLRGDIEQVGVPSVLAFLELEKKTGVLTVAGKQTARVHLRTGSPVRLELDGATAGSRWKELLFEVLDRRAGPFEFTSGDIKCADEIKTSVTALLLEHARRRDEKGR